MLKALEGDNNDGIALEQDLDAEFRPKRKSSREEKKDTLAVLQAMQTLAKSQWFHIHLHWAKAQDGKGDKGDDGAALLQKLMKEIAKAQLQ